MQGDLGLPKPGEVIGYYQLIEEQSRDHVCRFRALDFRSNRPVKVAFSTTRFGVAETRQILAALMPARTISHPNVERILDAGETKGRLWIASELASGISVEQKLRDEGCLPTRVAARYAAALAAGLREIHAAGLLHLGIKPASVMVDGDAVKLIDVGHCSLVAGSGRAFATPTMLAPEQVSGRRPDARTDVYAVGALLFLMLTGVPPFDGPTYQDIVQGILTKTPPRLHALKPKAAPLEAVVNRALQKKPEARFQSMAEFVATLNEVISAPGEEIVDASDYPFGKSASRASARPTPVETPVLAAPTWAFSAPPPTLVGSHGESERG